MKRLSYGEVFCAAGKAGNEAAGFPEDNLFLMQKEKVL